MNLSERDKNDINFIKLAISELSSLLNIPLTVNTRHVLQRMTERHIDAIDITQAIWYSKAGRFAELYRNYFNDLSDDRPFNVEFKTTNVILVWTRTNNSWKLTTILDPMIHSKHESESAKSTFYARINHK